MTCQYKNKKFTKNKIKEAKYLKKDINFFIFNFLELSISK